jgi:hypothetical protein
MVTEFMFISRTRFSGLSVNDRDGPGAANVANATVLVFAGRQTPVFLAGRLVSTNRTA